MIGTDLSAIQPNPRIPNCTFIKDDAEEDWVFHSKHPEGAPACEGLCEHPIMFDYVHFRAMFTCFNDPIKVMKSAYENLSPGGWVEFQEASLEVFQANVNFTGELFEMRRARPDRF